MHTICVPDSFRQSVDLVVAVVRRVAIALGHGAVHPAVLRHAGGEDVVEVQAEDDLLHAAARHETVAEAEVGEAVGRQGAELVLAVVQIHTAHEAGVPHGAERAEAPAG